MTVHMPAEWAEQEWIWIGFPHDATLWLEDLAPAQEQIAAFANAVAETGQQVRLVVRDAPNEARARELVSGSVVFERHAYGDIWLRDSGPLVIFDGEGRRLARRFGFNGWGGKYEMEGDQEVGGTMAAAAGLKSDKMDWILEGGAIDTDGTGLVVTTEQCLLNPNRNRNATHEDIAGRLEHDLGFERVVWLGEGLLNDHTDGHVDNLARFVAPGRVAIPTAAKDDPNEAVYRDAAKRLKAAKLDIVTLPSPGRIENEDGDVIPASYMNFYIGNAAIIVPQYGAPNDKAAVAVVQALFPGRVAIGLRADHVLTGGGSFHCISQQVPA